MTNVTIGVDVSKNHLDACLLPTGEVRRFTNDARGFDALIAWVKPHVVESDSLRTQP